MTKISVYLNSRASKCMSYSEDELRKYFSNHELKILAPTGLAELNGSLRQDVSDKVDYVFSVGGDGTVSTISQTLIGSDVKLMIIPAGTANDLAQELGTLGNVKRLSQIFETATTTRIDSIRINGRHMLTNGGLGMASEVAQTVDRLRKENKLFKSLMKLVGKEIYPLVYAHRMLVRLFQSQMVFIESKDFPLLDPRVNSPLILINNQEYIGGRFRVAPQTKNNDGKFNVSIFLHKNRFGLLKCTLQMMFGRYPQEDPNLISFETDQITLSSLETRPLKFFGDGEIFEASPVLDISLVQSALEVCTVEDKTRESRSNIIPLMAIKELEEKEKRS